ncbi:hypothetical protein BKA62DRAFT_801357 [Auriculariales sp. MPI-PUGE-AT-0066]|nr:hypothetical protein BKA62DRAFT_801357 [Auriculariales sp. MPI-PUGE-AT-0066]
MVKAWEGCIVDFALDEATDVVVAVDDGAVLYDVANGLVALKAKMTACEVSRTPRVFKALLLEARGRLAVDGLGIEVRASVAGYDAVEDFARGWWFRELDGRDVRCAGRVGTEKISSVDDESRGGRAVGGKEVVNGDEGRRKRVVPGVGRGGMRRGRDTAEAEVVGEVEDTRVSVERAGEVEEEMVEGTKARRTTAIAVGVGGVGGTKNSTKCNGRALPSGDYAEED